MNLTANGEIRRLMRSNGITLWMLADALNIHEQTLVRWFRHELPTAKKQKILNILEDMKRAGGAA